MGRLPGAWQAAVLALVGWLGAPVQAAVDDRGVRVELSRPPQRIVALAPALTETVCALGACARLVGTDRHSNWPEQVRALPKLGVLEEAQVERIVALRPDLVLATASARAVSRLEQLGLKVAVLEARTLEDSHRVLRQVGALIGQPGAEGTAPTGSVAVRGASDGAWAVVTGIVRGTRSFARSGS